MYRKKVLTLFKPGDNVRHNQNLAGGDVVKNTEADQAFKNLGQIVNTRWHETESDGFRNIEKLIDLAQAMYREEEKRQKNEGR